MKIKLIAIDLDGTLLTSDKKISPEAVEVIGEVRRRGNVRIILATARPPRSTLPYYKQLDLQDPMINYNGALVWEPPSGKILLHKPIPRNIARGIIKWARQRYPQIRVSAEIADKWYTDFYDGTYKTATAATHQPDLVAPINTWLTKPVTKLLLLGHPEWVKMVDWAIQTDIPNAVRTVQTEEYMLQVMSVGASKRRAVETLSRQLDVPQESVMAIGDNANDAGMIQWAGVGVAMANGHVVCLQVSDHVADHHDKDGVANILRDLVLNGKEP